MKKIKVDPPIDTILPLKGAHRQVALEYVLRAITLVRDYVTYHELIGMTLKESEYNKVMKEVNKIKVQLQRKIDKTNGSNRESA